MQSNNQPVGRRTRGHLVVVPTPLSIRLNGAFPPVFGASSVEEIHIYSQLSVSRSNQPSDEPGFYFRLSYTLF